MTTESTDRRRLERLTIDDLLAEARRTLVRLEPHQAAAALSAGALLLDTRQHTDRWRDGVIAGSLHTPRTVLEWVVDPSSGYQHDAISGFDQVLVVMCNEGYSSSLAAATLQRLGFARATDLIGGFAAWKAAGLAVQAATPHDTATLDGRWPAEPAAATSTTTTQGACS